MSGPGRARAYAAADAVLGGDRHPQVGSAMYFHTAGRWYPYSNMHYVAVAGGNAFYEKRSRYAPPSRRWNQPPAAFAPVAERRATDPSDRVRLATFLSTGQGLYGSPPRRR